MKKKWKKDKGGGKKKKWHWSVQSPFIPKLSHRFLDLIPSTLLFTRFSSPFMTCRKKDKGKKKKWKKSKGKKKKMKKKKKKKWNKKKGQPPYSFIVVP